MLQSLAFFCYQLIATETAYFRGIAPCSSAILFKLRELFIISSKVLQTLFFLKEIILKNTMQEQFLSSIAIS
jgi:hypothetical protein